MSFLHEDILFETQKWGEKLNETFLQDEDVALIGIAGSKYKFKYFSGWFSGDKELDCANYIHQYKDAFQHVNLSPENGNTLQDVVCIDGVFMCCKKKIWEDNHFNHVLLKGFHFYDIDFSLRIARSYTFVVSYQIGLIHITTGGDYGNNWVIEAMKFHEHMKTKLPFTKVNTNHKFADRKIIKATLDSLKNHNISFINRMKWVVLQKLYLSPTYYYSIAKFFLYKFLRLKYLHNLLKTK